MTGLARRHAADPGLRRGLGDGGVESAAQELDDVTHSDKVDVVIRFRKCTCRILDLTVLMRDMAVEFGDEWDDESEDSDSEQALDQLQLGETDEDENELNVGDGEQAGRGSVGGHGRHPLMSAASRGQMLVSFGTARQAGRGSKNLTIGFLPILYFWRENRAKESADSCS